MGLAIDATGHPVQAAQPQPRARRSGRRARRPTSGVTASGCETTLERPAEHRLDPRARRSDPGRARPASRASRSKRRDVSRAARWSITTGTFLNGLVHIGPEQRPSGRAGEPPSQELAESLKSFGFDVGTSEDGHAAATSSQAASISHDSSRSAATIRPVPFSFLTRAHRSPADRLSSAPHDRPRSRPRARSHIARVAALQRSDLRDRSALLPVARRQGDALSAPRASPDLSRAGGSRRRRDLRQRLLDEPSGETSSGSSFTRCQVSKTR